MKKPNDFLNKKKLNKTIDNALSMNNSSYDYVNHLLITYDDVFTEEEKENLNNLKQYLGDTLNLFFNKLKV